MKLYVERESLSRRRGLIVNYSELNLKDLELALSLLWESREKELPDSLLHLQEQDWMALAKLLVDLEQEKERSQLH